ncbi:MAG: 50S ribosomal protein L9 [Candidatus Rokubacteria bacterium]|nr:50S ribosomal protein L9 [Candidatus Rokubacteria bacterium]
MKVILLDDLPKLGRRGEVRDVSDGYARNYLLPQKLALLASPANLKNLDQIKKRQEAKAVTARADAEARGRTIEALALSLTRQASEEGRLYGSVGVQDLVVFLAQHGIAIEKRRVGLHEPIKALGEYTVPIRLHPDVTAQLRVTVSRK